MEYALAKDTLAHSHVCYTSFLPVTGGTGPVALYVAVRHHSVLSFQTS